VEDGAAEDAHCGPNSWKRLNSKLHAANLNARVLAPILSGDATALLRPRKSNQQRH
jgi:hypothetical protein